MTLQAMQRSMRDWLQVGDGDLPDRFEPATAPGLRVYQNNYRAQLVSCLEQSFPHTRAWIGERASAGRSTIMRRASPPGSPQSTPTTMK